MKTLLIELRYNPHKGQPHVSHVIDGMNDVLCGIVSRFGLDLLSVSHVFDAVPLKWGSYSCTAICQLNGQTLAGIAQILHAENASPLEPRRLYCFEDGHKLSINVYEISYN